MRKLALLGVALAASGWPAAPVLACQQTYEEAEAQRQAKRWARRRADVLVIGTLQIDAECNDFGERCLGRLSVTEVQRGNPNSELSVRFEATYSMCDGRFWPAPNSHTGLFYLNRDARSDTYKLVEFVRLRASDE